MNHVIFDVMNARVTFRNVPIHELSKFAFKDVGAAAEEFTKIPGIDNIVWARCGGLQLAERLSSS